MEVCLMSYRALASGLVLAAAVMVGCDNSSSTDSTPDTTTPAAAPSASPEAQAVENAREVAEQAQQRTGEEVEATEANAQKLLDQAMEYIKENKWDLAEQ